jgi:hypothetical protein
MIAGASFFVLPQNWWLCVLGGLLGGYDGIAGGLATRACRLAGVSQEAQVREVIERGPGAALAPHLREAPHFKIKEMKWVRARVDSEGIEGSHAARQWRRVLWRDIETCVFTARRDAVGRYKNTIFSLQDSDGTLLLHFSPPEHSTDEILAAIRFYLRAESTDNAAL